LGVNTEKALKLTMEKSTLTSAIRVATDDLAAAELVKNEHESEIEV